MDDIENVMDAWNEIPHATQDALIEWYNIREEDLDPEDYERLVGLYAKRQFVHYDCANCGNIVRYGHPDNWAHFQGVSEHEGIGSICGECYRLYEYLKEMVEQ